MTANAHFKKLVRARMAATDETYTTARANLQVAGTDVMLGTPRTIDVHGRHGQAVAFTPDGTRVLSGGQDARVAVIGAASGIIEAELSAGARVNAVAFSRSGRLLAVAAARRLTTWSHEDEPVATTALPIAGVYDVAFSPDGRRSPRPEPTARCGSGPCARAHGDGISHYLYPTPPAAMNSA